MTKNVSFINNRQIFMALILVLLMLVPSAVCAEDNSAPGDSEPSDSDSALSAESDSKSSASKISTDLSPDHESSFVVQSGAENDDQKPGDAELSDKADDVPDAPDGPVEADQEELDPVKPDSQEIAGDELGNDGVKTDLTAEPSEEESAVIKDQEELAADADTEDKDLPEEKSGNSYKPEITSDRIVSADTEDTEVTVRFTELDTSDSGQELGSARVNIPEGFEFADSYKFDPQADGSIKTSDSQNWSGRLDSENRFLALWALDEASYLGKNEWVMATIYAAAPADPGIYSFETEGWTNAELDSEDAEQGVGVGDQVNMKAEGCSAPTISVNHGSGTSDDPFQVESPEQLDHVRYNREGKFEQTADIDLGAAYNEAEGWDPIGEADTFNGSYNGNDYKISNLEINSPQTDFVGLFGRTGPDASIKNVRLEEVLIDGDYSVGGLVGINYGSMISCRVTGSLVGNDLVGILTGSNHGTITGSYSEGDVSGNNRVGGMVGFMKDGYIFDSHTTASVTGDSKVGGLVGRNNSGTIKRSYAAGSVKGESAWIGGLVGWNNSKIDESYAAGPVSGGSLVGGLVGLNYEGSVEDSYADGSVAGISSVGGLVGKNTSDIMNSYATGSVSGTWDDKQKFFGGLVGDNEGRIIKSYATGDVEGDLKANWFVGGLAGINEGIVKNSYSTGKVSGDRRVGGLVGYNGSAGIISTSYAASVVAGNFEVGGLVGYNDSSADKIISSFYNSDIIEGSSKNGFGQPISTDAMIKKSTFADQDWDISLAGESDQAWWIYEDSTYPLLSRAMKPLEVVKIYDGSKAVVNDFSSDFDIEGLKIHGEFEVKDAGTEIPVNIKLEITGEINDLEVDILSAALQQYYFLPTGTINKKDLTLSNFTANHKIYDGTCDAEGTGFDDDRLTGDVLYFMYDAVFEDRFVGKDKLVGYTNIIISGGADQANYNLVTIEGTAVADITPLEIKNPKETNASKPCRQSSILYGLGSPKDTTASFISKQANPLQTQTDLNCKMANIMELLGTVGFISECSAEKLALFIGLYETALAELNLRGGTPGIFEYISFRADLSTALAAILTIENRLAGEAGNQKDIDAAFDAYYAAVLYQAQNKAFRTEEQLHASEIIHAAIYEVLATLDAS